MECGKGTPSEEARDQLEAHVRRLEDLRVRTRATLKRAQELTDEAHELLRQAAELLDGSDTRAEAPAEPSQDGLPSRRPTPA